MTKEVWIFYKTTYNLRYGYRQYYVSNWGRVMMNGELYICTISSAGYYRLCGKLLHRIIAEKFLPDYYENCEIDHKDCNKLNNMVTNLLVCRNRKENINNPLTLQHMKEAQNNLLTLQRKRESGHKKPILQYTLDNMFVSEYVSTKEASRQTKINKGNISQCCNQKRKSAGGYIWKYKNI